MSVVDLRLTSGRHVNDVVIDQHDDLNDELPFEDKLNTPTENAESEVMSVVDLRLTSGRHVNDVVIDQHDDLNDELPFEDKLNTPTENAESEVIENILNPLDHLILSREKRKAIKSRDKRWTDSEVPFEIDYSQFNNDDVNVIFQAMNEWQNLTCIRFRPRTEQDRNFVKFVDKKLCNSYVGMIGGAQDLSLAYGCVTRSTVAHEIGHAIGFYHEQSRPDRDQFITIFTENIETDDRYNFDAHSDIDTYDLPYDYRSIMHYGNAAFAIDTQQPTIKTNNPYFQTIIGITEHLSFYDVYLANLMYNCNQKCDPSIECPRSGFQGPNCECWCQGETGIQNCDSSNPITVDDLVPPSQSVCEKLSEDCQSWKVRGECTPYNKNFCPMYCNYCDVLLGQ